MNVIDISFLLGKTGAEVSAKSNNVAIVIDALRASSTIVTLFIQGFSSVHPLEAIDNWEGLCIGENNGNLIPGCTLNNSPSEIKKYDFQSNSEIAMKTSNGSACIITAKHEKNTVIIGAALNAMSCADYAVKLAHEQNVGINFILAGCKGEMALEDLYVASLIYNNISVKTKIVSEITPDLPDDLLQAFNSTEAAERLISIGYANDIELCAQQDVTSIIPYYDGFSIKHIVS